MCFEDEGSVGKLDGRTAPITGGAKRPGRAIAPLFARDTATRIAALGRPGTVDEVVPAALLLAADDGAYYVGACIGPNGGDVMV